MEHSQNNYFRFVGLRLRDYRIFRGVNDFSFSGHRTLIVGKNGIGKTTISDALRYLGPSKGQRAVIKPGSCTVSCVAVITDGNCDLLDKYRSLIFINGESVMEWAGQRRYMLQPFLKANQLTPARKEAMATFRMIVSGKQWKRDLCRDFFPHLMSLGEKICYGYAVIFALRKILGLDIPLVLDSPYARLNQELRKCMRDFLVSQPCQQILLGHECEFSEEEKPNYILVYVEDHSHVMEY